MVDSKQKVTGYLRKILESDGYEILQIDFPDFDSKGGYSAEMVFADAKVSKNGREELLHLIIKRSKDNVVALEELGLNCAYRNEVNFYSKIIPYMKQFALERNVEAFENVPKCYGTLSENDAYVIIMENLKLKKFRVHDIKSPYDMAHIKLIIEAYAKWHALCFALKDQKKEKFDEFMRGQTFGNPKVMEFFLTTINNEFNEFTELYKKRNESEEFIQKVEKTRDYIISITDDFFNGKFDKEFTVLRHGDCWNNNFIFQYDSDELPPNQIKIIDWQLTIEGPPLADVCQGLFFGAARPELDQIDEILKFYYDTLSKRIKDLGSDPNKCFPWEACLKQFKQMVPLGLNGVPIMAKMSCRIAKDDESYDIVTALEEKDYSGIFKGEMRDPEVFFNRIDGILKLCFERNLI